MILAGPAMTSYAKPDWPADTGIQSEAGIVMDMDSKTVIFGQNIHVQKAPASITKLLTALVVIENANLDDMVTFPMTLSTTWKRAPATRMRWSRGTR